ncbi:hypothetical protein L227DRAFT_608489 [Lentinus tigrinus ALCF2SS1-6]|uniref:RING-type domain-containing protein n=1 Tax=Lentinus tigrinus ALCF2SS1-6 TaxID=1328759 RepID=A0A5C2SL16_9APHY|nr:hypothetical protein L227DRAFT_608489 [Lentinus tigrinus ALCF2SS1-6]
MASYNYVDAPNVNLTCCICRSPFVEPCTTRTCCHTFCYECIAQAIATNRQCPIDRTPLALHDLLPADPVIRNLVDELIVNCPQEDLGCSYTCQRLLLPIHLGESCQFVQVGCPNKRCNKQVLRKDVSEHQCPQDQLEDTDASASTKKQPRPGSNDNEKTDPPSVPSSTPTAESGNPPADLAAENAMLRLRLSALESVVHILRSEMFAVKHALGPWYRPDVQPELLPEDQSAVDEASSEAFERQLAEEIAMQPVGSVSDNPSSPSSRDPTDIASYFPPAEDADPIPPSRQTRQRNTPSISRIHLSQQPSPQGLGPVSPVGSSGQTSYANPSQTPVYPSTAFVIPGQPSGMPYPTPGTSLPATSPAAISIPPLDPSTPLPDTLASLHSSLVTLAGALGALAASRGAESLRTTEELRGLRGAMHGLRMQIHDILTSRTHPAGTSGTSGSSHGDSSDPPTFNLNGPGWFGYRPRPYGTPPMHAPHPSPFGMPPPTNIPKL